MPSNNNKVFQPKIDPNYIPNAPKEVLDKPIDTLNIYPETQAKLESVGIKTVFDVAILEMKYLYRIENMSKKDVFAVMRGLHSLKLDFKKSERAPQSEGETATDAPTPNNKPKQRPQGNQNNAPRTNDINNVTENQGENNQTQSIRNNNNRNNNNPNNKRNNDNRTNMQNFDKGNRLNTNAPREQRPNNAPPQRERMNTREDFNENGTMKPGRERMNSRDFDRNGKNRNQTSNTPQKPQPVVKQPIKLPPLVIEDGLYKFFRTGKWGYKDDKGATVIEPQFDEAYNFNEGMAGVELNEHVGFINKAGELVIEAIYDTVCSFTDGLASVTQGEVSWYVDKEGNKQFDMDFESATPFKNGSALVKKDGKWNFICKETGELRPR